MHFADPDNIEQLGFETNSPVSMWNSFYGTEYKHNYQRF